MEQEVQKLEQADMEEQDEEESTLIVRKSRNGNDSKTSEIHAVGFEVSDGVYESNGHTVQSKMAENGAEIEELKTPENDQKIEDFDGVLENATEAIKGEQESQNLVFYDKVEGIRKCRICSWTYCNGSVCVDHIQNHKGQLHKLMNLKTLDFESEGVESTSTYSEEKQILKDPGPQKLDISSLDFVVQNNSTSTINNRYEGEIEKNSISSSNINLSQISFQEGSTSFESSKEIDLINEDDLEVTELDVERVLQKQKTHDLYCPNCNSCITTRVILRKRKRRIRIPGEDVKRNKTEAAFVSKLGTGSAQSPGDQVNHTDKVGDNDAQTPAADEEERRREPDVFRCLSCFSFFIPTGNGFKLFRRFEKSGKENVREEQAPSIKENWFTSMFTWNKQETTVEQGSSSQRDVRKGEPIAPSSNVDDQSGQPSFSQKPLSPPHASDGLFGTTVNNETQEVGDKILPFPSQKSRSPPHASDGLVGTTVNNETQEVGDKILTFPNQKPPSPLHASNGLVGTTVNNETQEVGDKILPFPNQKPSVNGKEAIVVGDKSEQNATETVDAVMEQFDAYTGDHLWESKSSKEVRIDRESDLSVTTLPTRTLVTNGEFAEVPMRTEVAIGKSVEDAIPFPREDGLKLLIPANKGSSTLENSEEGQIPNQAVQPEAAGHVYPGAMSQHIITETKTKVNSNESLRVDDILGLKDAGVAQGKDTVIMIDQQPAKSSQLMQGTIHPTGTASASQTATQSIVDDSERTEASKKFEIEVIKSIVYGGLAESITSLSVVSSAGGGGAATLNVLALGAANLIGGLFIICYNLWDLKCDQVEQVSNQIVEQRDRYKELLGRRQNFMLHAIVAIISYLVFGLVPPVVYGFSFHKSDDTQLKLVVVAAASLLCILVLAIGKAYIQSPPKPYLKTIVTFVILGFMVSGISYAAGELVERLLEKLGLFQTSSVPNLVVPETTPVGSGWSSY